MAITVGFHVPGGGDYETEHLTDYLAHIAMTKRVAENRNLSP